MLAVEIVDGVHQLTVGGTNFMVIAEEQLTLVDTGMPGSSARAVDFIRRLGRSVEEISSVIITHNHFDHIGGVPELRRVARFTVAAHRAGLADAGTEPPYPEGMRRLLRIPLLYPVRRRFVLEPGDVDLHLEGGEVLGPLGGLHVVHTPGHTPGSISLYSPRHRLLMVGDALQRRRRYLRLPVKMVSTDLPRALASVKQMAELDVDIILFGHGRPLAEDAHAKLAALIERTQG